MMNLILVSIESSYSSTMVMRWMRVIVKWWISWSSQSDSIVVINKSNVHYIGNGLMELLDLSSRDIVAKLMRSMILERIGMYKV